MPGIAGEAELEETSDRARRQGGDVEAHFGTISYQKVDQKIDAKTDVEKT